MLVVLALALLVAPALGRSLDGHLPFIVNGDDVDTPGKYGYQASFQYFNSHSCGAAIISNKYLISAAHCCSGTSYYTVLVGAHDIKTLKQGKPTRYTLASAQRNPGYGRGTGLNEADICVLTLSSTIDMTNSFVKTIALPDADAGNFVGSNCVITGWGNTQIGSTGAPNILQEANTKPLSVSACKTAIAKHPYFTEDDVVASHICIGSLGNEGSCHGDSGGPMACPLNGKTVLAGVTSWGDPQCNPKYPTMYTRITPFRSWIKGITGL